MTDKELKNAMSEVQDAMRQAGLTGSISFFDGDVTEPIPFASEDEFEKITPYGGGGTSYHPIFERMEEFFSAGLPKSSSTPLAHKSL